MQCSSVRFYLIFLNLTLALIVHNQVKKFYKSYMLLSFNRLISIVREINYVYPSELSSTLAERIKAKKEAKKEAKN